MSKIKYSTFSNMQSIITDDLRNCYICGHRASHAHHCIGGAHKAFSEKHHLLIPLCAECHIELHSSSEMEYGCKVMAQQAFESKVGSREEFIKQNGKSYL